MVVFIILLGVHGVVVLIFVVKVVVGVIGQVAQTDGDDGRNVGVNFFRTPVTTRTSVLNRNNLTGKQLWQSYHLLTKDSKAWMQYSRSSSSSTLQNFTTRGMIFSRYSPAETQGSQTTIRSNRTWCQAGSS